MQRLVIVLGLAALAALACAPPAAAATVWDTRHMDHRGTLKLAFEPAWDAPLGLTPEGTARAFLEARGADFGVSPDLAGLEPAGVRESLLARHVTLRQVLGGVPIQDGEIVVSVARRDGRVMRVFNNTYPVPADLAGGAAAALDQEAAYEAAWNHLRARGDLLAPPQARLVWTPEGDDLRLSWLVDLDLAAPHGGWRVRVDARTGAVVEVADRRLERLKTPESELTPDERIAALEGPAGDRREAFARQAARARALAEQLGEAEADRASGTGVVFDPDPRTTLQNPALQDNSPASAFDAAYVTRDLLDIAYDGQVYRLDGPWVHILNWDPPNTPPSTTPDGQWTRVRGNNSFNDAMTYFHLDQNQRYMQSLGFVGATGIQYGSIGADSDGFNGADNSAYYSGTNRLTFGHGCVDDNEDADVILHEYGHAITHDISNSWTGGDTGAMGEGFGDYWGGAYSYGTPNGPSFHPEWIYSWDGHGNGNPCWAGRILNALGAQYVHSTYYGAHQQIPGGYWSDELWSTPLFQALVTLVEDEGQTRESVDAIYLEAQFGLGAGIKMRDMANAIVATARELQPAGPHADVMTEKFLAHAIILAPVPAIGLESFAVVAEPSGNGAPDPGETVELQVVLNNTGLGPATGVSAVLATETPGVTIVHGETQFPDLAVGANGAGAVNFSFAVDGAVPCGTLVRFSLQVSYDDGDGTTTVERGSQLFVGVPVGAYGTRTPYAALPDNDGSSVVSTVTIEGTGATVSADFNVDVNIAHTYVGDLIVILRSPQNTAVFLHLRQGGAADDLVGNYPQTLTPAQPLTALIGEPLDGTWQLSVRDAGSGGTGTFNTWSLYDITDFTCDGGTTDVPAGPPTRFALAQNAPNPFNPATTIRFEVPADAGQVTLAVFDLAGRRVRTLEQGQLPAGRYARLWQGTDDHGRRVGSGIYVYRLTGRGFSESRKLVVVQ